MTERAALTEALQRQAATVRSSANIDDVLRRARRLRRLQRRRRAYVGTGIASLVIVASIGVTSVNHDTEHVRTVDTPTPSTATSTPAIASASSSGTATVPPSIAAPVPDIAGMFIDDGTQRGGLLERHNSSAVLGPFAVVVRRADGSLGRHGAVVTYPAAGPARQRVGELVIAKSEYFLRVHGDLGADELATIAAATRIDGDRPIVSPPPGFSVTSSGPLLPTDIREARYGSVDLGEGAALGDGLAYTGVEQGAVFEDHLYDVSDSYGPVTIGGHPAIVSGVRGGSATLAWEPAPGVVAYVGYSGSNLDADAAAALERLAARAKLVDLATWDASSPFTNEQDTSESDSDSGGFIPLLRWYGPVQPTSGSSTTVADTNAVVRGRLAIVQALRCVGLTDDRGNFHVIVWPAGTRYDAAVSAIVLADGQRLTNGQTISGAGRWLDEAGVHEALGGTPPKLTNCGSYSADFAVFNQTDEAAGITATG